MSTCAPALPSPTPAEDALVVVAEGPIPDMERLLRDCKSEGLEAALGGQECCTGGGCGPKAALLIHAADISSFRQLMNSRWAEAVGREGGDPEVLARIAAATAADLPVCPACGHIGELVAGECGDCGLVFG